MPMKWKKKKNKSIKPELFVNKLSKMRIFDSDGKVSFKGFYLREAIANLTMMMEIENKNISLEVGRSLFENGLWNAARLTEFNEDTIKIEVNKLINKYLRRNTKKYFLLTTINIKCFNSMPKARIDECNIQFKCNLPKEFKIERDKVLKNKQIGLIEKDESFAVYVLVSTFSISETDAFHKMFNAVNLLRGIWNFALNGGRTYRMDSRKSPLNKITLGELFTIHRDDKCRTCEKIRFDSSYHAKHHKITHQINIVKLLNLIKKIRLLISKSNYKEDIISAFIKYVNALDLVDYSMSIINLWSVLEHLTFTVNAKYDVLIKRVNIHCVDQVYHEQVLENLRNLRNHTVHFGDDVGDIDVLLYQVKEYVEVLLGFHLKNRFGFKSIEEASGFMDLPQDVVKLKNKISLYRKGLDYLS